MTSFDRFANARILVIGDLMLDRYWWGDVDRISPEAPVPIVRLARTSVSAGGAANVAANIAGFGARAVLIGITGDDGESRELNRILDEDPLVEQALIPLSGRKTTVKTRIVAHNQHVVRLDQEDTGPISTDEASLVIDRARTALADVDAVIVSDYAKGLLTEEVLSALISAARVAGKMLFVDPKGKDFSKYRGATMITPNLHEAADACGLGHNGPEIVLRAGRSLVEQLSISYALVTEGANGMTLFDASGGSTHLDAAARKVFDVTGAGDTVIAAFAVAAVSGMSFGEAARLANLAAGIAVGQVGTAVVTREQLEFALSHDVAA
jgi:rfaE bifunctional protein kinase chain/domain